MYLFLKVFPTTFWQPFWLMRGFQLVDMGKNKKVIENPPLLAF